MTPPRRIGTKLDKAVTGLIKADGYFLVTLTKGEKVGEKVITSYIDGVNNFDLFTLTGAMQHRVAFEGARREILRRAGGKK